MIKFELKKIKYLDAMSEETPCFTAEIWENGKKVANVKNGGYGGGNQVDHLYGINTYKDVAKFDNMDVEAEIFGLVWEDFDIRRLQGKGLVLKKDGEISGHLKFPMPISKLKKASNFKSWKLGQFASLRKQGYEIMNRNI